MRPSYLYDGNFYTQWYVYIFKMKCVQIFLIWIINHVLVSSLVCFIDHGPVNTIIRTVSENKR